MLMALQIDDIREKIPSAARMRTSEFRATLDGELVEPKNASLTYLLLARTTADPDTLRRHCLRRGKATLIHRENIVDLTCTLRAPDHAAGTILFNVDGVISGRVDYEARRDARRGWEITRFVLPDAEAETVRGPEGRWEARPLRTSRP